MKQTVRLLNDAGTQRFRSWLQGGGAGEPPFQVLLDPTTSGVLSGAGEVEQHDFMSRYELAEHVLNALQGCDFNRISYAAGLWAWLSLFYVDLLCPKDRQGQRIVLELPRYLLTPEYRNYYRHLIREAVILIRRNGEYARALLTTPTGRFRISSVFEEVASRQDLISNTGVVELVWRLYFHPKRQTIRTGVASHGRPGGIQRFALVLQQLSLNYDLPALAARQIADLLPPEFEPWKRRANWEQVVVAERPRCSIPRVRFDTILRGSLWRMSHLAEHWGYGDVRALRGMLIAPRGQDFLVLFVTGENAATDLLPAAGEHTFQWRKELAQPTARRLAKAAKTDTPVHLFQRSKASAPFVYLGKALIGALVPGVGTAWDVTFRLVEAP